MTRLYVLSFVAAFMSTALFLWLLPRLAARMGLLDEPGGRKQHGGPTPVVGGLAVLLGCALAAVCVIFLQHGRSIVTSVLSEHVGYVLGGGLLAAVGLWDDIRPLPARYKLLAQLAACLLAVCVDDTTVGEVAIMTNGLVITPGPLTAPFTVVVMLTVTNAMNMIDGIDGLAGGMIVVALAILAKATTAAGYGSAIMVLAFLGGMCAFLTVNFPFRPRSKAKVFLGDCGSMLFGYTIVYLSIGLSSLPNRLFKPSTALWLFFIPVADTIWLYLRRTWYGRAPFSPGRDHIHHLLLERLSTRQVTFVLVGLSAAMAAAAYLAERRNVASLWLIGGWLFAFLLYGALTHRAWRAAWLRSQALAASDDRFVIDGVAGGSATASPAKEAPDPQSVH